MVTYAYYSDNWENLVPGSLFFGEHQPEQEYDALTKAVVALTGHETIVKDFHTGELISRRERDTNYGQAVKLVNSRLKLGMDENDIEIMTLVYTALSEVTRFGGDIHIHPVKGENTGTHSLHTPLRADKIIRNALKRLDMKENRDSVIIRQLTGLCLVPHDDGEQLGEPSSLAQEADSGKGKDKPGAERRVFNSMLRWAAYAVEKGNKQIFYDHLDGVKMADISKHANLLDDYDFMEAVRRKLGNAPEIRSDSKGRVTAFMEFWDMVENKGFVPDEFHDRTDINGEFISLLASLCEHAQGSGHFNKFCQKEIDPEGKVQPTWRATSARIIKNMQYVEGELGALFAVAKTPLEKAIAIEAKREVYSKCVDFFKNTSSAIDRKRTYMEFDPSHPQRDEQIRELVQLSERQGSMNTLGGHPEWVRDVETRERMTAMYEWARDNDDFVPEPGQILLIQPPAHLLAPDMHQNRIATSQKRSAARQT